GQAGPVVEVVARLLRVLLGGRRATAAEHERTEQRGGDEAKSQRHWPIVTWLATHREWVCDWPKDQFRHDDARWRSSGARLRHGPSHQSLRAARRARAPPPRGPREAARRASSAGGSPPRSPPR